MAKRKPPKGNDIPEWVVTYGDLMSLLLCFFILIVAFSEPKKPEEFQKVLDAIQEAMGFRGGDGKTDSTKSPGASSLKAFTKAIGLGKDAKLMADNPQSQAVGKAQNVTIVQEGPIHAIGGSLPFSAGKAGLSLAVEQTLRNEVAPKIRDKNYIVRIVGHSFGDQDKTLGSHLDASYERAKSVRNYLIEECNVDPLILRLVLAGDQEPSPENNGADAEINRRVQVYMTDKTLDQIHPDPYKTGRNRN